MIVVAVDVAVVVLVVLVVGNTRVNCYILKKPASIRD